MMQYDRAAGYPKKSMGNDGITYVDRIFLPIQPCDSATLTALLDLGDYAIGDTCPFNDRYVLSSIESAPSPDGQFMYYDLGYILKGLRPMVDTDMPVVETQGGVAGRAIALAKDYRVYWDHCLIQKDGDTTSSTVIDNLLSDEDYYKTTVIPETYDGAVLKGKFLWIQGDTPIGWHIYSKDSDRIKNGLTEYQISSFTLSEYYLYSDEKNAYDYAKYVDFICEPRFIQIDADYADLFFGEFLCTAVTIQPEGKAFSVRVQYQFSPWATDDAGEKVEDPNSPGNYLGGFDHDIYRVYSE